MKIDSEQASKILFEIASEQRISIIKILYEKKCTVSQMAKILDATVPEVSRNFDRLKNAGLIIKDVENNFTLTTFGKSVYHQISSLVFIPNHMKYFSTHVIDSIPTKFIQRIGQLESGIMIKGVTKTMEKWKRIYKNADKYINNILTDVPYDKDFVDTIKLKLEKGINIKSIFTESAIIPDERKKVLTKINFKKFLDSGKLEKKMIKTTQAAVILNEKEAGLMFSTHDDDIDITQMLYSDEPDFHDWCMDYFKFCYDSAVNFQEAKLG